MTTRRSVAVGAAGEVEHPLQRDLGVVLGVGVDRIRFTTTPSTSDSSAHTRWGRSIRFIVEQ